MGAGEAEKMVVQKKVEVNSSHSHLQKFQQAVVDFHAVAKRPKVALSRVEEMEEEKEEGSDDGESESDEDSLEGEMGIEDLEKAEGWYQQLISAKIKLLLWNLKQDLSFCVCPLIVFCRLTDLTLCGLPYAKAFKRLWSQREVFAIKLIFSSKF